MKKWVLLGGFGLLVLAIAAQADLRRYAWDNLRSIAEPLVDSGQSTAPRMDTFYVAMVENLPPQQRAQQALQMAINQFDGASQYLLEHAQLWRGEVVYSEELWATIGVAVNSRQIETRLAAFELALAASDIEKSAAGYRQLQRRLQASEPGAGSFQYWMLGALAARGVAREEIFDDIILRAWDAESTAERRQAVDTLGRMGGQEVVQPLLELAEFSDDVSIQERAFCNLAQSGTLHLPERYTALPGLLAIADSADNSETTISMAYQALREITGIYDLPEQPDEWLHRLQRIGFIERP